MYSDSVILTTLRWFIITLCNEYAYNVQLKQKDREPIHNLFVSILVFARVSYLFWASCILLSYGESKSTTSYLRVVKYEYDNGHFKIWIWVGGFHHIKISMNAYKYRNLLVWFDATHRFEYSLTFSTNNIQQILFEIPGLNILFYDLGNIVLWFRLNTQPHMCSLHLLSRSNIRCEVLKSSSLSSSYGTTTRLFEFCSLVTTTAIRNIK